MEEFFEEILWVGIYICSEVQDKDLQFYTTALHTALPGKKRSTDGRVIFDPAGVDDTVYVQNYNHSWECCSDLGHHGLLPACQNAKAHSL